MLRTLTLAGLVISAVGLTAHAQEKIQIGAAMPITGPVAHGALQEKRGLEIALEEINAKGGVLGKQIELLYEDNQCNPSLAVTVTNKLLEAGVPAVLGQQCSSAVLATMPLFQKAEVPLVSSIATNPKISQLAGVGGNPWVFRLNPSDRELAVANVNYLASLGGIQKIAIVAESTDYGRGGADAFAEAAKDKGLEVVSTDFHPLGAPDFTTIIARLQNNGAQAVAVYQAHADNANFARQAHSMGLKTVMTGKLSLDGDTFAELIKQGAYDDAVTAFPYSPAVDTPENKDFAARVLAKYGESATYETFAGYESLHILAQAIERAGSAEPKAIRDALVKTSYKSMIGATVDFDDHNQAHNNAVIITVKDRVLGVRDVFPTK
ncbi:ABC transporter substrate-binding protein [Mesorhizobium australicum]|uniref:Amino acid/amide ABC transporter substrate-binding protein, HAAT family n=1 Tax=Mesorhizobium australicum TaxID=536018 RepID=A0A1X7NHD7_9HYPH|nr:ABC transporter substrate-binding protein [Mesorhizobium australicum]SMH36552.1 amino acid/amide ABC transporter substrate-binding protein, HAAT family [Mesorhizobium australicum]